MKFQKPSPPACRCTRREALRTASAGFGMLALAGLMAEQGDAAVAGSADPMAPKSTKTWYFSGARFFRCVIAIDR